MDEDVRVKVQFLNPTLDGAAPFAAGNAVMICAIWGLKSFTALLNPFLDGKFTKTKTVYRIEKTPSAEETPTAAAETLMPNASWSGWCS
jgi:hypothetical protein